MTGFRIEMFALAVGTRAPAREEGATAVEHGLIFGLIAVAIIAAVILLGGRLPDGG